jgi:LacI family transcriptional regulator
MVVTIRDVAERAGVSISTVSRVLNDICAVKEDKRVKVLEAAEALGYTPNPAARSLLGKKTGGIGVVLPFVSAEFFSEFLTGLDQEAQGSGYFLVVSTSHRLSKEFESAMQAMRQRVDGMIVMAPELGDADAEMVAKARGAVVFVNTYVTSERVSVVNFDNYGGSLALTNHLLELGHRRIAIIKGPASARDAIERASGYRDAMNAAGVSDLAGLEVEGEYTQEAGYRAAQELLDSDRLPTAIVAANDYCAIGALRALNEAGVRVPEEIAVAGFDGITSSQFARPALTTVHVPIREIGRKAIRTLVELVDGRGEPKHDIVPVELLVRASTSIGDGDGAPFP